MWFIFRAKPEKSTTSPPFVRAKRAQKCLLMRILNLCMVSNKKLKIWQQGMAITELIYDMSVCMPNTEKFG
ncbi:MAG: hypothetical protein U5L45_06810 [Saprospiraceae bacterium]|nr:hypothetical protein [Saprospiraceae bacterium]